MMRRKKRTGRPHATERRPARGCVNVEADNVLPLPNHSENSKRRFGWVAAETSDSLLPWRSDNAQHTRGKQS
jgi:hypothetical protein